ncbi:hypothetical protein ACTXJK_12905 [Brachybacterium tyrofermentans]|uniref:hypothetical protein n=1 Tax=Brachybacterium tyrofermentans TaxID=47848 RepID=UPI003FD68744
MDRRKFFTATFVGAAATMTPLGASALAEAPTPTSTPKGSTSTSAPEMTDADLEAFEAALAQLPPELQEADPSTYPHYEAELRAHLPSTQSVPPGEVAPAFNLAACAAAIVPLILEYGIPVAKVVGWIRRAGAIWGGVRGIWAAIRSGAAAAEIGEDAVQVLEGILGVGGVVTACSL